MQWRLVSCCILHHVQMGLAQDTEYGKQVLKFYLVQVMYNEWPALFP